MNLQSLRERIRRLELLGLGFSREYDLFRKALMPLEMAESQEYLDAVDKIKKAIEAARMALVKATHRREEFPAIKR